MTDDDLDAYRILQVDPRAEDFILEAAFRAMARRFHPDGEKPDSNRMAEINRAYELIRTSERRKRYDRLHHRRPMGPGGIGESPSMAAQAFGGRVPPPSNGPGGPTAADNPVYMTVDFGRYQGWTLKDLLRHDPDYLRWLYRHSSGVRYRYQIARMLPDVNPEEALAAKRNKY
ncbi:MAG TPA: DnaJ domain-containing protein [Candidatus Limnocylindria bacterium]|nr:DnaJ domain-containing protein [Candidatus Limnocylindria bacterium]